MTKSKTLLLFFLICLTVLIFSSCASKSKQQTDLGASVEKQTTSDSSAPEKKQFRVNRKIAHNPLRL